MSRFFVILMLFIISSVPVQAQEITARYVDKPLPKVDAVPEDEFVRHTLFYDETPYEEEFLSYQIHLPKDWVKAKEKAVLGPVLVPNFLREVVRFDGAVKNGTRGRFTIRAEELTYKVTAVQWFLKFVDINAYTLQGLDIQNDNRLEAFYVLPEGDIDYIVRAIVAVNGKTLVFAEYRIPVPHWNTDQGYQNQAIKSFRLNTRQEAISGEKFLTHQFLDFVSFDYPSTWIFNRAQLRQVDQFEAQITKVNAAQILQAQIYLKMVEKDFAESLGDEVAEVTGSIVAKGLVPGDVIERLEDYTVRPPLKLAGTEAYELDNTKDKSIAYEFIVTIMAGPRYYYILTMITPSRGADYFLWSRNLETYKLVAESVKVL